MISWGEVGNGRTMPTDHGVSLDAQGSVGLGDGREPRRDFRLQFAKRCVLECLAGDITIGPIHRGSLETEPLQLTHEMTFDIDSAVVADLHHQLIFRLEPLDQRRRAPIDEPLGQAVMKCIRQLIFDGKKEKFGFSEEQLAEDFRAYRERFILSRED